MDEFSRPATLEDLKLLLRSLHEHGADYLLIGGYALAAHGYQRATTDIDVVVPATLQAGRMWRTGSSSNGRLKCSDRVPGTIPEVRTLNTFAAPGRAMLN
jgi:hypothetical protein